jgi:hypothetical protein
MASLVAAALWVIAASATAMLPMRRQMIPGIALLATAPALVVWIGLAHGWAWVAVALLAFASLFRRPLGHLIRRARGLPTPTYADLVAEEAARR